MVPGAASCGTIVQRTKVSGAWVTRSLTVTHQSLGRLNSSTMYHHYIDDQGVHSTRTRYRAASGQAHVNPTEGGDGGGPSATTLSRLIGFQGGIVGSPLVAAVDRPANRAGRRNRMDRGSIPAESPRTPSDLIELHAMTSGRCISHEDDSNAMI